MQRTTMLCMLLATAILPVSRAAAQPMQNRLMIATSRDGLTFERLGLVAYDSADVPDAVMDASGEVFLYFQGNQFPRIDAIMVGRSANGIDGWSFQPVAIAGIVNWKVRPCDPDIVYRDGLFRLYFTGDPLDDHVPETYSATSTDGVHFTLEDGVRFSGNGMQVLDPSLLWTGDTLQFFAGGGGPSVNWHAVSTDGLAFTRLGDFSINGMMMSNGIPTTDGYRFYGFPNRPPPNILSISSRDGSAWSADTGVRLAPDPSRPLEGNYVKDPAIVRKDSLYIMYYVTRKPESSDVERNTGPVPPDISLGPIYPNPACSETRIAFSVGEDGIATLSVVDMLGRQVLALVHERLRPGTYAASFDAALLPDGVYICRLLLGKQCACRTITVMHGR